MSIDKIFMKWEEDQVVLKHQKNGIHVLFEDNHRVLPMTYTMKMELKEVHFDFEALTKSVRMLSPNTQDLDNILKAGKIEVNEKGLGFSKQGSNQDCSNIVFVRSSRDQDKKLVDASSPKVNVIKQKVP